ncbi:MAG: hydrogenase maturation protease [Bacteroidota bacterium]
MPTAVLGFGNPVRGDDAVGVRVAEQLQTRFGDALADAGVSVFDMGTSAFEVLFQLRGHDRLRFVDAAVHTGHPVGTVFKVPAAQLEREATDDPLVFLHALKWDQALRYARQILRDAYPDDVEVYLVAIEDTRLDAPMSADVEAALDRVVEALADELELADVVHD